MKRNDIDGSPAGVGHLILQGLRVYLRPYRWQQALLLLSILPSTALTLLLPLGLAALLDRAIPQQDSQLLWQLLVGLALLLLLATSAEILEAWLRADLGQRLRRDLRQRLFQKLMQLPLSFHDGRPAGDLAALFARELMAVRDAYRDLVVLGGKAALQILLALIAMWLLHWRWTLVLMLLVPLILHNQLQSLARAEAADREEKRRDAEVVSLAQDQLSAIPISRALGLGPSWSQEFAQHLARHDHANLWHSPDYLKLSLTVNTFQNLTYTLTLLLGGALAYRGHWGVGQYSAAITLIYNLAQAINQLSAFCQSTLAAATALERLEGIWLLPHPQPRQGLQAPLLGAISLRQITFGYAKVPVLQGLTLDIAAGQMVALVGRSGSGKSTILRLIVGLYQPQSGQVLLDGQAVDQLAEGSWAGQLGVVTQELHLLNRSVADNLRVGKPQATQAELQAAAEAAEIHQLILSWPQQYQQRIGEGGKWLSPGQRQRLALARALVCQPRLLLLDEVTSALDPESEGAIHATLRRLARERTLVVVTHRLALASWADQVVVLDQGRVVQQGCHQELLQNPGPYRKQWLAQSGFTISQDGRQAQVSRQRLQAIPLFEDLTPEQLDQLASKFLSYPFQADQTICQEGQPGQCFYILARGRARVWHGALHVATLEDGDYFGEEALLDGGPYATQVVAEGHCLVLSLEGQQLHQLLSQSNQLLESLQDTSVGRSLTLFGRRGRRPSSLPSNWDPLCREDSQHSLQPVQTILGKIG